MTGACRNNRDLNWEGYTMAEQLAYGYEIPYRAATG